MVYGIGTRSFNRSTEHREMKRAQAEATAAYLARPREIVQLGPEWLTCRCRSFDNPHEIRRHKELRENDWRTESERKASRGIRQMSERQT
jgi:hypothetical protein